MDQLNTEPKRVMFIIALVSFLPNRFKWLRRFRFLLLMWLWLWSWLRQPLPAPITLTEPDEVAEALEGEAAPRRKPARSKAKREQADA